MIHNAIDERFLAPANAERMDLVRQRYQLDHPFVLYVGNIKPHKNIERLIDAFGRARSQCPDDLKLVIIGDEISKYPALRQSVHKHKLDKHVRFLGFQPMETLAAFYRLARAFVFPSLYEGFGLPPLEAMACGAPVVTSNVSSLPEVAGGAALLVDPYDADAIAERHRAGGDGRNAARRPDQRAASSARDRSRGRRACARSTRSTWRSPRPSGCKGAGGSFSDSAVDLRRPRVNRRRIRMPRRPRHELAVSPFM